MSFISTKRRIYHNYTHCGRGGLGLLRITPLVSTAIAAFGALAQESRLKIFRLLVQRGPDGTAAGDIARRLKLPQNTLSFHIAALSRAHLVASRKEGRSIIYFVDLEGTRGLLSFLVEYCCGGKPELCGCLIASVEAGC